jgi:hypothetical protein
MSYLNNRILTKECLFVRGGVETKIGAETLGDTENYCQNIVVFPPPLEFHMTLDLKVCSPASPDKDGVARENA